MKHCTNCKFAGRVHTAYPCSQCRIISGEGSRWEAKKIDLCTFRHKLEVIAGLYDMKCVFDKTSIDVGMKVSVFDGHELVEVVLIPVGDHPEFNESNALADFDRRLRSIRDKRDEMKKYIDNDVQITKQLLNRHYGLFDASKIKITNVRNEKYFGIKKVVFNDPATIVIWNDGTKTIVKCQEGDIFDPEKGLAMAISKRALGDKGNFNDIFRKWVPEKETVTINFDGPELKKAFEDASNCFEKAAENFAKFVSEHFPPMGSF